MGNSRLNTSGNVSIGGTIYQSGDCCSTPTLYPETNWYFQLGTTSSFLGDCFISHELYKVAPSLYSDRTVKDNINYNLSDCLAKLKKLKPVSYNLDPSLFPSVPQQKINEYCRKQYGVIAQDLVQVFPELVDTIDGKFTVQYNSLIAILIASVQQQQAQIDSLKQVIYDCCNNNNKHHSLNLNDTNSRIEIILSNSAMLYQNAPNPFGSGGTKINYFIPQNTIGATIVFYDMYGNKLQETPLTQTGMGTLIINPTQLSAGIYTYSLVINGNVVDTKKMVYQK